MKKTIFKHLFAFLVVILLIFAGCRLLDHMLVDDADSVSRLMMHEFYEQDGIDVLFVGASHGAFGIDPAALSEKTNRKIFNACTYGQFPDTSFAIIQEAERLYHPDEIYFEVSKNVAEQTGVYKQRESLTSTYLISDYLRLSLNKLVYLLNASSAGHYVNSFFPARRNWEKITDLEFIHEVLEKKSTSKYKEYSYSYTNLIRDREYRGNGFIAFFEEISDHGFLMRESHGDAREPIEVSEDWKNTIRAIIDFCEKHQIKLTLYAIPESDFQIFFREDYDEYLRFLRAYFEGKDVHWVDFNLLKEEFFPYIQTNFNDEVHFNEKGAEAFTSFLADYMSGKIPDSAFHHSVSEKFDSVSPYFYGALFHDDHEKEARVFHLLFNRQQFFEYRAELVSASGDLQLLQNYDTNEFISVPFEQVPGCELIVTFRPAGSDDAGISVHFKNMEIVY